MRSQAVRTSRFYRDAIRSLQRLLHRAQRTALRQPTAAALATADPSGRPSVRMVLLKEASECGLVFYTNLGSRKGKQLAVNPRAALCWFADPLHEQVIIEGRVALISDAEADAYWASRPRQTRLGAWASLQSQPLASRRVLMTRVARYARRFAGRPVPRPPQWSGWRVIPDRIEFWKARAFRLNERIVYQRSGHRWTVNRLYP